MMADLYVEKLRIQERHDKMEKDLIEIKVKLGVEERVNAILGRKKSGEFGRTKLYQSLLRFGSQILVWYIASERACTDCPSLVLSPFIDHGLEWNVEDGLRIGSTRNTGIGKR